MIHRQITGWLQMSAGWRLVSFTAATLLLLLLLWFTWWYPLQREQQQLAQQLQQQRQHYRQLLQALPAIPSLVTLQQQVEEGRVQLSAHAEALSLPELLHVSDGTLEYWHPAAGGGELAMQLQWSGFMALLHYLSSLCPAPDIPRFRLQREGQQLRLLMEITHDH
ncbi:type II secretion system protein GspM [Erwinia persicina]|uniref:type II secretion system protein GspM n=1 Tax=Erwinia persicina TaxID=55211 RepID=UPI001786966B|nr:hypothetical protein [Erwinia persicina]MBD8168842.1 hypothetical protein [Erwinia persicina]